MTDVYLISKSDNLINYTQSQICHLPQNTPKFKQKKPPGSRPMTLLTKNKKNLYLASITA